MVLNRVLKLVLAASFVFANVAFAADHAAAPAAPAAKCEKAGADCKTDKGEAGKCNDKMMCEKSK